MRLSNSVQFEMFEWRSHPRPALKPGVILPSRSRLLYLASICRRRGCALGSTRTVRGYSAEGKRRTMR